MLSASDIETALSRNYELRGVELKVPGPRTNNRLFAKVTRAALSMANLRDGGHVIVGIADDSIAAMLPGLNPEQQRSWENYDAIARKLRDYADPPLHFELELPTLSSGAVVAVIYVYEFDETPVLCSKDYRGVLRKGACYVRSRAFAETAEISTQAEMRDLLDLAIEKRLRAFVERTERAGVALTTRRSEATVEDRTATERFAQQRKGEL